MLQRLLSCVALVAALFSVRGLAQAPARCATTTTLSGPFTDIIIELGEVNCFTCSQVSSWTANNEMNNPISVTSTSALVIGGTTVVEVEGNYLILPSPGQYVLPGNSERRNIICTDNGGEPYEARLSNPTLVAPRFASVTVNEFTPLTIRCDNLAPTNVGRAQIFNPDGEMVGGLSYTVANATREFGGTYSCVATSRIDPNITATTPTEIIVRYAPEITPVNVTSHRISLGAELRLQCGYVGVPSPNLQWIQNSSSSNIPLESGSSGVTVAGDQPGDTTFSIVIDSVGRDGGGTYTCRANNSLGMVEFDYTVLILIPPAPVTMPMVTLVGEREIGLSWMTGFDGFTPITGVMVDITPERGAIADTNRQLGVVNSATITGLLPFRSYDFSITVVNSVGASDPVVITESTLSLKLDVPQGVTFMASNSTSIVLTWSAPLFDSNTTDDPNYYIINFSREDGSESEQQHNISSSVPLRVEFNDLAKGTRYQVTITPFNDGGEGNTSAVFTEQTLVDPPSMPTAPLVEGVGAEALKVSWERPEDDGGRPLADYRIVVNTMPPYAATVGEMVSERRIMTLLRGNGLMENTTYTVFIAASNTEQGFGANATAMGATQSITLPQQIFDIPLPNDQETTNRSAVLTWQYPGGTVDLYLVEYVLSVDGFENGTIMAVNVSGNDTSVMVRNLLPGSTYDFRVTVINSLGRSASSTIGKVETLSPDAPVITSSHTNPIDEGTNIMLNCTVTLENPTLTWTKDDQPLPPTDMFDPNTIPGSNFGFLRIINAADMTADGTYTCTARLGSIVTSTDYVLEVVPTQAPDPGPIDQTVIIIVASVGGAALLVFIVVVIIAVCCLCVMKRKNTKGNYGMKLKPVKKERQNANWIETSTQFVPATGNQLAADGGSANDRLAFDYSVDLQTHSSFNTLEKQKVHSTHAPDSQYVNIAPEANGAEETPSYVNAATVV